MRRRYFIGTALIATAAVAAGPVGGVPAKSKQKVTELTCTLENYAQGMPNPTLIQFGFANCPKPFGKGLHYSRITVTPTGPGQGTATGTFKNFYNLGSAHGTASLTFAATAPGAVTYTGTVTYVGGTGRFGHVRGSGTIDCTSTDAGAHRTCTVHSKLTGI
jgi:hypothetical protein